MADTKIALSYNFGAPLNKICLQGTFIVRNDVRTWTNDEFSQHENDGYLRRN